MIIKNISSFLLLMDTENQKKNKTDIVNKYIYQWKKIKQNKTTGKRKPYRNLLKILHIVLEMAR